MNEKQDRRLKKLQRELGNEICQALADPQVIEVMLNSDGKIWIEKIGQPMTCIGSMTACNAESLLGTIADSLKTTITRDNPILEGELELDGSRFEGLIPPVVSSPSFTIRKKASVIFTLNNYVEKETMTFSQKVAIETSVLNRKNILIAGGTGSGKTTLTNAVIDCTTENCPEDRLVIIEDTAEIQCSAENSLILRTSIEKNMQDLLKATMRLRPDRILVGEVRGGEALALLKAWNTGHPGGVATVHANGARAALIRLEQLIAETGMQGSVAPLIGEAIDLVIFIAKTQGGRKIKEIVEVNGVDESGNYITRTIDEANLKSINGESL